MFMRKILMLSTAVFFARIGVADAKPAYQLASLYAIAPHTSALASAVAQRHVERTHHPESRAIHVHDEPRYGYYGAPADGRPTKILAIGALSACRSAAPATIPTTSELRCDWSLFRRHCADVGRPALAGRVLLALTFKEF
jgi:hypothetical protein